MNSLTALYVIGAILVLLFAAAAVRGRSDEKNRIKENAERSWGSRLTRLFSAEQISSVRAYSDGPGRSGGGEDTAIDDITAGDLDLDLVFAEACRTYSAPGDEVLYSQLRNPLTDPGALASRRALITLFRDDPDLRLKAAGILSRTGRLRSASYYQAVSGLSEAEPIRKGSYIFLSAATVALLALLFFFPLPAILLLIPVLFLDFRVHISMREKTGPYLMGFQAVLRMLRTADAFCAVRTDSPEFKEIVGRLRRRRETFSRFRRGTFLVMTGGYVGTGFSDALIENLNMFFHLDLIRFNGMLAGIREHAADAEGLISDIGALDAAISAASYEASLPHTCEPEFSPAPGSGGGVFLAEDLYHPLLPDPVANSIRTESQILITGSNASGKSTFMKSAALAAILAQSFGFAPALVYRAPMYRIVTSMALRDNMMGGESYFAVEIRSLLRIWKKAEEEGLPVLAVIDEVLRGTNTVERIAASSQILSELAGKNIRFFAATHDIELAVMLDGTCRNLHFDETCVDGDIRFDYRIREGRAEGRNAIRLLRSAGFGGETADRAEARAAYFEKTGEWKL